MIAGEHAPLPSAQHVHRNEVLKSMATQRVIGAEAKDGLRRLFIALAAPYLGQPHPNPREQRQARKFRRSNPGVAMQGWGVDMKRKAHESNIPPNPAPRIEFMILSLWGWKDWGLVLGFLGLSEAGFKVFHYSQDFFGFLS